MLAKELLPGTLLVSAFGAHWARCYDPAIKGWKIDITSGGDLDLLAGEHVIVLQAHRISDGTVYFDGMSHRGFSSYYFEDDLFSVEARVSL